MEKKLTALRSPFTGGRVFEVFDEEEREFRKEKFQVHCRYYVCEDTGEQFTGDDQEDLWVNEVYSQWRIRHGVPFPEEITSIRLRYGMNYTQISKIMGFGVNQWKQYEDGCMPSESNGKMIRAVTNKSTMLSLLESSRSEFSESEYDKLLSQVKSVDEFNPDDSLKSIIYGRNRSVDIMNGYGSHNPAKVSAMVKYLVTRCKGISPTKLNKMMFYSDFYNFRRSGCSISGLQYRAIQFGPVPDHYDTIYDNIPGLEKRVQIYHEMECTTLSAEYDGDTSILSKYEIGVLDGVLSTFGALSTSSIIERSHQETAWINHEKEHGLIPYSEAFGLK